MQRYAAFIATKRGLTTVLQSGNPAFDTLPAYFEQRLRPALRILLGSAAVRSRACACPPAMTAMRGAWSLSSSTGYATARATATSFDGSPSRCSGWRTAAPLRIASAVRGRFDYVLVGPTGIFGLPAAEPRAGRRTVLTVPLLPPPQKN